MNVFLVTFTSINPRNQRPYFIFFESHHGSVAALTAALNTGDLVLGNKLIWRTIDKDVGVREIIGREPASIRLQGIGTVELPQGRIVEFTDGEGAN